MRSLVAALALALHAGVAGAAPLELPESVRTALASARAAQKEHRNEDAVLAARAGLARVIGDPVVQTWHLAPLLRTMAEAYEQAGSDGTGRPHHDTRQRRGAGGTRQARRPAALVCGRGGAQVAPGRSAWRRARTHGLALRDLVSFLERADPEARVPAIETLLDDVRLAIDEGNHDGARASLALATFLANLYRIDLSDLDEDATELLELLESGAGDDAAVRITQPGQTHVAARRDDKRGSSSREVIDK